MITKRIGSIALAAAFVVLGSHTASDGFHFFRGDEAGGCASECCPATGEIGATSTDVGAVVDVFHNTYQESSTQVPLIVRIKAGQAVQWRWTSSHCHSVTADDGSFDSGFFYPVTAPEGQAKVISGFLDYPLPDPNPTLTYTRVFAAPGTYPYHCVHHQIIGMEGVVIVEE
ncbi:MAG: plastocyanin/azurin family copper-binding protein [Candidatus Binatia bacterium]